MNSPTALHLHRPPAVPHDDPVAFYTVEEVATLLHFPERRVRDYLARGLLPGVKIGRYWRIPVGRFRKEVLCAGPSAPAR